MSNKEITLQLVLKFLKDKGFTQSYLNLQQQSKINLKQFPKQIEFLKKLLLKGDFNEAVQFLRTFDQKMSQSTLKKLILEIYKQKLYELLQNPEQTQLRNLFEKQIINVCSQQEYQHLFTLLTCRSVKQIPGMDAWTLMKGRFSCFQQIHPHLQNFFTLSPYQKSNQKTINFSLEQVVQSFVSAEQKVQERMQRSQNIAKPVGSIGSKGTNKQSKESIEYLYQKKDNEIKQQKILDNFSYPKSYMGKQPYISNLHNSNSQKIQLNLNQQPKANLYEDVELTESKIQKGGLPKEKNIFIDKEQGIQSNTFARKYNPYIEKSSLGSQKEDKDNLKSSKLQDADDRFVYGSKEIKKDKQRQRNKDRRQQYPLSYLKQFQHYPQANDSQILQQEIKRNIAYLDQNNSVVYKQEQNQNFTFSNGAQSSGIQEKNRKILKLATFSDPKAIRTCQFSSTGSFFALGTNSSYLKIYPVAQLFSTNKPRQILPLAQIPQIHTKSIYCLDWSSNEKAISTCSNDLTIKVTQFGDSFNFSNYKTNVIGRHQSSVRMVKFNSLQNKIVSCGDDSLIKVWDIGKVKRCTNLKGHTQTISAFKFSEQEQDNILYSVSKDCTVRKWDLRIAQCVTISQQHDCQLTYIADNTDQIVASDKSGSVIFYNQQLQAYNSMKLHEQEIRSIDGTEYQDLLLTSSFDGHICLFSQKNSQSPNYHQHNDSMQDKVVFATFMNHKDYHGFASTSTMGICNIFSFQ